MIEFKNLIARAIDLRVNQVPHPRWATILAYDPQNHLARVTLQPEGVETGWLPILSPWVGNQFGLLAPLVQGQQCVVLPHDASPGDFAIIGLAHSEVSPPPQPGGGHLSPGELALVHQSGSYLKFSNSGDVLLVTNRDLSATVGRNLNLTCSGTANVQSSGNLTVDSSGSVVISSTGTTTISGSSINLDSTSVVGGDGTAQPLATQAFVLQVYDQHTHPGIQPGGGTTGTPTILSNGSSLTTQFRAS